MIDDFKLPVLTQQIHYLDSSAIQLAGFGNFNHAHADFRRLTVSHLHVLCSRGRAGRHKGGQQKTETQETKTRITGFTHESGLQNETFVSEVNEGRPHERLKQSIAER